MYFRTATFRNLSLPRGQVSKFQKSTHATMEDYLVTWNTSGRNEVTDYSESVISHSATSQTSFPLGLSSMMPSSVSTINSPPLTSTSVTSSCTEETASAGQYQLAKPIQSRPPVDSPDMVSLPFWNAHNLQHDCSYGIPSWNPGNNYWYSPAVHSSVINTGQMQDTNER